MMDSSNRRTRIKRVLRKNLLLIAIVVAVVLGFLIGILAHDTVQESTDPPTEELVMYIMFPGEIFIRMLRMIILPLTVSSIVVALAQTDTSSAGKLGRRTLVYYLTTTVFACILGITLIKIIKPGENNYSNDGTTRSKKMSALDSFLDLMRNLFPDNLIKATFQSTQTKYTANLEKFKYENRNISVYNSSAKEMASFLKGNTILPWKTGDDQVTIISNDESYTFGGTFSKGGTNYMGIIVFSVVLGIIVRKLNEDGQPLLNLFSSLLKAVMMLVSAIMWFAPIGIFSLVTGSLVQEEDIVEAFRAVALFLVTVFTGIFIQSFIFYPLIYFVIVRKNPFVYFSGLMPAIITAFGTSSSSATLPVTIRCVTENNKVDRRVAQFVLPIGATCNMDGSALGLAVAILFIANVEGISMNFGQVVVTALVSVFVSTGSSGIPSAGMTYLILCLEAVGLPTGKIGLILSTEWMRDRVITVNNVLGDAFGAGIIYHTSKKFLQPEEDLLYSNHSNAEKNEKMDTPEDCVLTMDTGL